MRDVQVVFPAEIQEFLRTTIASAGGNEVFFLGRIGWSSPQGRPVATLEELDVLARGNRTSVPAIIERAAGWHLSIHNHPSGHLEPSEADLVIAHDLASRGVGFAIISNDAARQYIVVPPFDERVGTLRVEPEEVRAVFAPDGPISRELGDFEERGGQVEMALEVARALNEDRVLAAEAGTGIGKSFAYLVPSILWAVRNKQRIVVATGTINLQEQLVSKDLPFLAKVLSVPFRFALIKGRNNYACRRKVAELEKDFRQADAFPGDERTQLESLVEWVKTTSDGSRSDLAWVPPPHVWEHVMSETDTSLKLNCEHYHECFYYQAKRSASNADIVVANHHLFFADLAVRRETGNYQQDLVIPAYTRVIFDEAHHLEDVASDYFGVRVTRLGLQARLSRLLSPKDHNRGAIPGLVRRLRGLGDSVAAEAIERSYKGALIEARERVDDAFHEIEAMLRSLPPGVVKERAGSATGFPRVALAADGGAAETAREPEIQLRYRDDPAAGEFWEGLSGKLKDIERELGILLQVNDRALRSIEHSTLSEGQIESQSLELKAFGNRMKSLLARMDRFRDFGEAEQVRWIAAREGRRRRDGAVLELASAPIRVAGDLKSSVYDALKTVVLTSATLSVADSVEFVADRLGLSGLGPDRFDFQQHASPFDFASQAMLAVPSDFPLPESGEFERAVPEAVLRIVTATRGRAFVLFTSYGLLRRTHAALSGRLTELGLRPIAQGDASRSELLERFRDGAGNVLFGTDSFWEGVDVKGKALECVIITRLPFRVPSEPVQEARLEDLESRGENPFTSFTVPQAVLKLKQGFGRLIRARTDRGVVAILDRRILTKPYGRVFLASLPPAAFLKAPLSEVVRRIERFFSGDGADSLASGSTPFFEPREADEGGPPW